MADKIVMKRTDTKKCRIVPVKNRHVPDVLLHNKRITEETTMDLNKMEIRRAMSFAEVFVVDGDTETLVTDQNFYLKDVEEESGSGDDDKKEEGEGTGDEGDENTDPTTPTNPDSGATSTPAAAKVAAAPARTVNMNVNKTVAPTTTTAETKKEEK